LKSRARITIDFGAALAAPVQHAKTNSANGFEAICRTKDLAARGCGDLIADGSVDQSDRFPIPHRTRF